MATSSRTKLNCSSRLNTNRKKKSWANWVLCIIIGVLSLTAYSNAQQHFHRRPITTSSPGMDAYRNRWMAYIRRQSTPKPATQTSPTRAGQQAAQIVNGFHCTRIHAFFTTEDNPRMYHLCARSRDSWYVYHFFCPQGSIFDESMKKCSMPRRALTSRPLIMSTPGTTRTTARSSVIQSSSLTTTMLTTRPVTGFASYLGLNGFFNRPTTSASTTASTTTTTEIPEAAPEPEPSATEMFASSEESTEEEMMGVKNVFVNIPGLTMSSSSAATPLADDDEGNEEVTTEIDTPNDEESNVIPESGGVIGNGAVALENSLAYQLQQVVSMHNKTNPSKTMEMVASILKASSAGKGRRPRVTKQNKWHYYRFLN